MHGSDSPISALRVATRFPSRHRGIPACQDGGPIALAGREARIWSDIRRTHARSIEEISRVQSGEAAGSLDCSSRLSDE